MSGYRIESVEYHERAIRKDSEHMDRMRDMDVYDCALSNWSAGAMINFHNMAIRALKLGAEHGFAGPACETVKLFAENGRELDAKVIDGKYGKCWLLSDSETELFGRRFLPFNGSEDGRITRKLGIETRSMVVPASRWAKSHCAFVGAPVSYWAVPASPAEIAEEEPLSDPLEELPNGDFRDHTEELANSNLLKEA